MLFEIDKKDEELGGKIGYAAAYLVFTMVLFFILSFADKLPAGWTYFHVAGLVFAIALIGKGLKEGLK